MTPEQKFWQLLKPHVPGHVNRIENSTSNGIPDVNYCYKGQEVWLELKAGSKVRDTQKIWHQQRVIQGGRVLLVSRKDSYISIQQATKILGEYITHLVEDKPWDWDLIEWFLKGNGLNA